MASRAQVAGHLAQHLAAGRSEAIRSAAAWLVNTGRTRQAGYLARDVAAILATRGHVLIQVTTARPLTDDARQKIQQFCKHLTGASELELEQKLDPTIIGGAIIETPGAILDASVRTKLARYVEGVLL